MHGPFFWRFSTGLFAVMLCVLGSGQDRCTAAEAQPVAADHPAQMKAGLALFRQKVGPLLQEHCLGCHGGKSTKADFDLSTRATLFRSDMVGSSAAESTLIDLIEHRIEPHMPHGADKLTAADIEAIGRWLDLGAPYDGALTVANSDDSAAVAAPNAGAITDDDRDFWSFRPLAIVAPPRLDDSTFLRTPIDAFILAKQQAVGLAPNPSADRRVLIRRAYFDLLGLPPTPEEIQAFVADDTATAYEQLIDRLLDSPRYGERWARHWLDIARFAESHGYEQDDDRPNAYPYRDFLIRALNEDMPYDQFVRWQLAGDELSPDDPWALAATGFLGGGAFPTQLTETEFETTRYDELDDMTATTGSALLGLSVGCARCHDHKFDPIPTRDYYQLLSTFTTTVRSEIPLALYAGAEPALTQISSEGRGHIEHRADARGYPYFYPQTYVLRRGDVNQKEDVAEQSFLQALMRNGHTAEHWHVDPPSDESPTSFRRTSLANWLTDEADGAGHLAARVIVNRLWQHHFGRGIVGSPNDFGLQGDAPTHPELLDWLAADLIHHGWRLKRLHKLIMTSAVYRQSTASDETRASIDRENELLWRRAPQRLEAEPIRDAMLAVSGLLDDTMYGPGSLEPDMRRRSVYFFIKRSQLIPMMMLFDWPEHLVSIGDRSSTTTAPQALMFMNNPQTRECAVALAKRLSILDADAAVRRGMFAAWGRDPGDDEAHAAVSFVEASRARYEAESDDAAYQHALTDFCQMLFAANEFVYVE